MSFVFLILTLFRGSLNIATKLGVYSRAWYWDVVEQKVGPVRIITNPFQSSTVEYPRFNALGLL